MIMMIMNATEQFLTITTTITIKASECVHR